MKTLIKFFLVSLVVSSVMTAGEFEIEDYLFQWMEFDGSFLLVFNMIWTCFVDLLWIALLMGRPLGLALTGQTEQLSERKGLLAKVVFLIRYRPFVSGAILSALIIVLGAGSIMLRWHFLEKKRAKLMEGFRVHKKELNSSFLASNTYCVSGATLLAGFKDFSQFLSNEESRKDFLEANKEIIPDVLHFRACAEHPKPTPLMWTPQTGRTVENRNLNTLAYYLKESMSDALEQKDEDLFVNAFEIYLHLSTHNPNFGMRNYIREALDEFSSSNVATYQSLIRLKKIVQSANNDSLSMNVVKAEAVEAVFRSNSTFDDVKEELWDLDTLRYMIRYGLSDVGVYLSFATGGALSEHLDACSRIDEFLQNPSVDEEAYDRLVSDLQQMKGSDYYMGMSGASMSRQIRVHLENRDNHLRMIRIIDNRLEVMEKQTPP